MSLEHYQETAIPKDGVYDVLYYFGKLVLISLSEEDTAFRGGKSEGDLYLDNELRVLTPAMLSVVSGGVKPDETALAAIQREVSQETQLDLPFEAFKAIENSRTDTIQQRKGNGLYHIEGTGFKTHITPVGLSVIERTVKDRGGVVRVLTKEEAAHLTADEARPFFRSVLQVMAAQSVAV